MTELTRWRCRCIFVAVDLPGLLELLDFARLKINKSKPWRLVLIICRLPTAQNVFTIAMRYDRGVIMSRDTIFVATPLSVPVILIITWLLA